MFLICSYFLRYLSLNVLISMVLTQQIACSYLFLFFSLQLSLDVRDEVEIEGNQRSGDQYWGKGPQRKSESDTFLFSRVHSTLYVTMSVHWSVCNRFLFLGVLSIDPGNTSLDAIAYYSGCLWAKVSTCFHFYTT